MNNWRELLNNKKGVKSPSIIDEAVTGVVGNSDSPDHLFYSEFSEKDCETFYNIFDKYKVNSFINQQNNIVNLQNNLIEQINSMPKNVCPIEVLLYTSNAIKDQIYSNADLYAMLKKVVAKLLQRYDCNKVVWYILSGWEWLEPMSILIEAIGDVNNDNLIKLAMNYYPTLAKYARDIKNKNLFKAYIRMILSTQNTSYLSYLVDIVSNKDFNDNELFEYFLKTVDLKESFTSNNDVWKTLMNELTYKEIPNTFIAKITLEERRKANKYDSNESMSSKKEFNVNDLYFGRNCHKVINDCKNCNDTSKYKDICEKIMESIDNISPKFLRGEAYILLGTKGRQFIGKISEFLYGELSKHPTYTPQISASLYSLDLIGPKDFFKEILNTNDEDAFKNIGNFFRYRSKDFSDDFLPYICNQILNNGSNEDLLYRCANSLLWILKTYNGKEDKLGRDVTASNQAVKIIQLYIGTYSSVYIYDLILDIVDFISICSSQRTKLLNYLDIVKDNLCSNLRYQVVIARINSIVNRIDPVRPGK